MPVGGDSHDEVVMLQQAAARSDWTCRHHTTFKRELQRREVRRVIEGVVDDVNVVLPSNHRRQRVHAVNIHPPKSTLLALHRAFSVKRLNSMVLYALQFSNNTANMLWAILGRIAAVARCGLLLQMEWRGLSIYLLVMFMYPARTAKPIKMPIGR